MTPYRRYHPESAGAAGPSAASAVQSGSAASKRRTRLTFFELQCIVCGVILVAALILRLTGGALYEQAGDVFDNCFGSGTASAGTVPAASLPEASGTVAESAASGTVSDGEPAASAQTAVTEQQVRDAAEYIMELLPPGLPVDSATVEEYARKFLENQQAAAGEIVSESVEAEPTIGRYPQPEEGLSIEEMLERMSELSAEDGRQLLLSQESGKTSLGGDLIPTALLTGTDLTKTDTFADKADGGLLEAPEGTSFAPFFTETALSNPLKTDFHVSSKFGYRYHPITGMFGFHTGVDLPADAGTSIYAAAAGVVEKSGYSDVWGNYLLIRHDDHTETFYAHCKKLLYEKGDQVKKGKVIAKVGTTGMSTGPHLHYEVRVDGVYMDPAWVLSM